MTQVQYWQLLVDLACISWPDLLCGQNSMCVFVSVLVLIGLCHTIQTMTRVLGLHGQQFTHAV